MGDKKVADVLTLYGIEKYIPLFVEQEIDYFSFLRLSEADLKELGLPIGPRKKITDHILKQAMGNLEIPTSPDISDVVARSESPDSAPLPTVGVATVQQAEVHKTSKMIILRLSRPLLKLFQSRWLTLSKVPRHNPWQELHSPL